MRLFWLLPALVLTGCTHVEMPVVASEDAHGFVRQAWGEGFDSGTYDTSRELSSEERREIEKKLATKQARGHVGSRNIGRGVPANVVVAEVTHLHPRCSLAMRSAAARAEPRPASGKIPYLVITRDQDGVLRSARVEAVSEEEALTLGKQPPT